MNGSDVPAASIGERTVGADRPPDPAPAYLQNRETGGHVRPIRVCFLIERLFRAGTEGQLLTLIRHLEPHRVQPFLCLLDGDDELSLALTPSECSSMRLGIKRLFGWQTLRQAFRFVRFLRRERIEIIQLYGFRDCAAFAVPLARLAGVRRILRVRNNLGYWTTPGDRRLYRILNPLIDVTLTNSEAGRQAVVDQEGVQPETVVVIENGVDVDQYASLSAGERSGAIDLRPRVGMVANLRPVKGVDLFVQAAARVLDGHPNATFHVAGEGPQRSELERMIADLGLENQFTLHGQVEDIPTFLSTLDVAVLSSRSEGLPNALLEFMAAGRAIVATCVGAVPRLLDDATAILVPSEDTGSLADAISRLLASPGLRVELGRNARERARRLYHRDRLIEQFQALYSREIFNRAP